MRMDQCLLLSNFFFFECIPYRYFSLVEVKHNDGLVVAEQGKLSEGNLENSYPKSPESRAGFTAVGQNKNSGIKDKTVKMVHSRKW